MFGSIVRAFTCRTHPNQNPLRKQDVLFRNGSKDASPLCSLHTLRLPIKPWCRFRAALGVRCQQLPLNAKVARRRAPDGKTWNSPISPTAHHRPQSDQRPEVCKPTFTPRPQHLEKTAGQKLRPLHLWAAVAGLLLDTTVT